MIRRTERIRDEASDRSIDDLTVGALLKRLTPRGIWTLTGVSSTVLATTFGLGYGLRPLVDTRGSTPPIDPIAAAKEDGDIQTQLRRRPAIAVFDQFGAAVSSGRWEDALGLTTLTWRQSLAVKGPEDLKRWFRMTRRCSNHYFIPRLISEGREEYDVDHEYADSLPHLPNRDLLLKRPAAQILSDDARHHLASDFVAALPRHFEVSGAPPSIEQVAGFVGELTIRDLVTRDDLLDELGAQLKLTPRIGLDAAPGSLPPTPRRRMVRVVAVRDGDRWRLDSYNAWMVEKR